MFALIRSYTILIAFLFSGLAISLSVGCQKSDRGSNRSEPEQASANSGAGPKGSTPGSATTPQANGGPGIDGSGGDTNQSTLNEVTEAVNETLKILPERLYQMRNNAYRDKEDYDTKYGEGAFELVNSFLYPKGRSQLDVHTSLVEKKIKIQTQLEPCDAGTEHKAGSARGDLEKGEICISLSMLQKVPPRVIKVETLTLVLHELSHLSNFNEDQAKQLQKLADAHAGIYSQYNQDPQISKIITCNRDEMYAEIKAIKDSAYWTLQMKILVDLFSGTQPRGCGSNPEALERRTEIFADDSEFLDKTRKFERSFSWPVVSPNARGLEGTQLGVKDLQDLVSVATLHLETNDSVFSEINAIAGSDIQCSPKGLVANLIANIPDILKMHCGGNSTALNTTEAANARAQREKEILEGENKPQQPSKLKSSLRGRMTRY